MTSHIRSSAFVFMALAAGHSMAQQAPGGNAPLALQRDETRASTGATIQVSSPTIQPNAPIPFRHSAYGDGISPSISWTAVPGARSYALVTEDPDAKPVMVVHWLAWNIPANVTHLPEGLPAQPRLSRPAGVVQGKNTKGSPGFAGPRPPVGDRPHHYHFQVLALDAMLDLPAGSDRDQLLAAARGHVLAKGELIGTFQQLTQPPQK